MTEVNLFDELVNRLTYTMISKCPNVPPDELRASFVMILRDYEVAQKTTDMVVYTGGKNDYLIKRFIIDKQIEGCTERTIDCYEKIMKKVLLRIGKDADTITGTDVQYYVALRMQDGVTKRTIEGERHVMMSFYQFMIKNEFIESKKNPMNKVAQIRFKPYDGKAFSDEDIERMRAILATWRERAMFETLLSTGCRVTELVNIKYIDITDDEISIIGKGEKPRIVYLNARAKIAIENYTKERKDHNPYLFPGGICVANFSTKIRKEVYRSGARLLYTHPEVLTEDTHMDKSSVEQIFRDIGKRAGVEDVHPHRFRRTCATFALRKGMPVEIVSKMLGHSQLSTTQVYLDIAEDDLKAAHKKYVT